MAEKSELRQKLRSILLEVTDAEAREASLQACALLRKQSVWGNARSVLFYSALSGEIDLTDLLEEGLEQGKTIALPRYNAETKAYDAFEIRDFPADCASGKFGISEPMRHCPPFPLKQLDLALVPGVGFDPVGFRLGRGQGFYDRLLAGINGVKCGVAFDQQIVDRIPGEPHDIRMNCILTPTRWLKISD